MTAYATCATCGSTLLWVNGELGCAPATRAKTSPRPLPPRFDDAEPADRAGGSTAAGDNAHSLRGSSRDRAPMEARAVQRPRGRGRPAARLHGHGGRARIQPPNTDHVDPLLVAVRSFSTTYYGERVDIEAGYSRVRASHPIAQRHPDAFTTEDSWSR